MGVLISNDGFLDTLIGTDEIEAAVAETLASEGVTRPVEVSVSFVDSAEMQGLNKEWRGIDAPTDVLSFECDSPFDADLPDGEAVELGDVILAPEVISGQAPEFDATPAEECRLMLVHGLLHLLGHDHMEDDEAREMEACEERILRALAVHRGDDPDAVRIGPTTRHRAD
ncbi:rRNA maturation RNase YbeY [Collinsella sp. An2]|uniref:rRNA maturation RNase YbeY n=1 Tax=Collinsella sp. An2 TaxID=1965585 RepID=UPI000B383BF0|nr:rRNA maturation RNase YbeY [Collinsella sp. An2]OUP07823.1 rRNA maturation RNase YbeY [Collinsella sp. An2]